jgi:hypothetical protein
MIFLITLAIVIVIAFFWVRGIDDMHKDYPDYKGEDLFDEEEDKK